MKLRFATCLSALLCAVALEAPLSEVHAADGEPAAPAAEAEAEPTTAAVSDAPVPGDEHGIHITETSRTQIRIERPKGVWVQRFARRSGEFPVRAWP